MFRAMFLPIMRSTWLYLQYLVVFTQVAAGWYPEWVETAKQLLMMGEKSPETCRAGLE